MLKHLLLGAASALTLLGAGSASAQSMNYGQLQDLFGEPVTTSATGKPQRVSEVPATMTIITQDEIRRSGARTLPDILNRVNGVNVRTWGVVGADVGIRNFNRPGNPSLLVLVNGRQVYLDHYGNNDWASIPVQLAEIRQIEIVKGPQAALFGFNAASGVINIITANPLYDEVGQADLTVGTGGQREIAAVKSFKIGERFGIRASAGGWNMDEFDTSILASERPFRTDARRRAASLDMLAQVTPSVQAGLEVTGSQSKQSAMLPNQAHLGMSDDQTRSVKASAKASTGIGLMEASAYHNTLRFDIHGRLTDLQSSQAVTVLQVQDLVKLTDRVALRVGGEYRNNTMNVAPVHEATVGYDVYAGSAMVDWQVTNTVSATAAGRYDRLNLTRSGFQPAPYTNAQYDGRSIDAFSYNTGLVWRPTAEDTLRAMAGQGFQTPSLVQLGSYILRPVPGVRVPLVIAGSPTLDPVKVRNYEVSYERAIAPIGGGVKLSAFRTFTSDLLATNPQTVTSNGLVRAFTNIGDSSAWGTEVAVNGAVGKVRWGVGYTWMTARDALTVNGGTVPTEPMNYAASTPKHQVKANVGYLGDGWSADLLAAWTSPYSAYRATNTSFTLTKIKPELATQAALSYDLTERVTVTLAGANFLRNETLVNEGPKVERRIWLNAAVRF